MENSSPEIQTGEAVHDAAAVGSTTVESVAVQATTAAHTATADVSATSSSHSAGANILAPDVVMVILTWVTFFTLLGILKKFAFKPILENLQKREKDIREALENADKAKAQLANIEQERIKILNEAKSQGAIIIDGARKTAKDLAVEIEAKAKAHAQEILQSAQAQIAGEKEKMWKTLRQESADIAVDLAAKILKENMDKQKNNRLVEEAVRQL